jgi:hypothetical protein
MVAELFVLKMTGAIASTVAGHLRVRGDERIGEQSTVESRQSAVCDHAVTREGGWGLAKAPTYRVLGVTALATPQSPFQVPV